MSVAALHALCSRPGASIALFRALMLGDLLCAIPAVRALRKAFPRSTLTLIGLPWTGGIVKRFDLFDDFLEFPGYPGLPERVVDIAAVPEFVRRMQAARFDLLLQMHGSGSVVNPLMALCGAQRVAGFVKAGEYCADAALHTPWPEQGHEVERLLSLTDHLQIPRQGKWLEFPIADADVAELDAVFAPPARRHPWVCVHPGSQLASRRWPARRFAAVADWLATLGYQVVLTGTEAERGLVESVMQSMHRPATNLCGRTSLGALAALIKGARMLVCNDTGVSHIAAAVGTRSVVISCGAEVARWAPLDTTLHHVLWQSLPCRPCGYAQCPYGHPCADAISVAHVQAAVNGRLHAQAVMP